MTEPIWNLLCPETYNVKEAVCSCVWDKISATVAVAGIHDIRTPVYQQTREQLYFEIHSTLYKHFQQENRSWI